MAALLGPFEQAVLLSVYKLSDDAYGRSILRSVELGLEREVSAGAVYATLDRLEQQGLLSSRVEASGVEAGAANRAGRARRFYRVSAVGVSALHEARAALEQLWAGAEWPLGVEA